MINGRRYVGQTSVRPLTRWSNHKHDAAKRPQMALHLAMRDHGIHNFEFSIIESEVSISQLDSREKHYIDLWNTTDEKFGYNMQGGGVRNRGSVHPATRKKISEASKAHYASLNEEGKRKWAERSSAVGKRNWLKGSEKAKKHLEMMRSKRVFGPEFREKTKARMQGNQIWKFRKQSVYVAPSPEAAARKAEAIRAAHKGKPKSEAHKAAFRAAWTRRKALKALEANQPTTNNLQLN